MLSIKFIVIEATVVLECFHRDSVLLSDEQFEDGRGFDRFSSFKYK
jgi:hypothetical protein